MATTSQYGFFFSNMSNPFLQGNDWFGGGRKGAFYRTDNFIENSIVGKLIQKYDIYCCYFPTLVTASENFPCSHSELLKNKCITALLGCVNKFTGDSKWEELALIDLHIQLGL